MNKILSGSLTGLQLVCLAGAYVLEDLSHKKAGVNHHVVYKKQQYFQTILDADHLMIYRLLVGVILAALVFYLIRQGAQKYWKALLPLILITFAVGFALISPAMMDLPAYVYLLFLALVVWLLEWIKTFLRLHQIKKL